MQPRPMVISFTMEQPATAQLLSISVLAGRMVRKQLSTILLIHQKYSMVFGIIII